MKIFLIAQKSLIEIIREVQLLGLTIALPLVFLVITYATYNADLLKTHKVWVAADSGRSEALLNVLEALQYEEGSPVFNIAAAANRAEAEAALNNGKSQPW